MESPELLERMLTMTHMDIQLYAVALHSFEQDGVQMPLRRQVCRWCAKAALRIFGQKSTRCISRLACP